MTEKEGKPSLQDILTPRQLQVLRLFEGRFDEKQIAARLHILPKMVREHIRNAYQRLEESNLKSEEAMFPRKFVYPDGKTLYQTLAQKTRLIGEHPESDEFYAILAHILDRVWSPVHEGMGHTESLAWELAFEISELTTTRTDLSSFETVFKALRPKEARSIVGYRREAIERGGHVKTK